MAPAFSKAAGSPARPAQRPGAALADKSRKPETRQKYALTMGLVLAMYYFNSPDQLSDAFRNWVKDECLPGDKEAAAIEHDDERLAVRLKAEKLKHSNLS